MVSGELVQTGGATGSAVQRLTRSFILAVVCKHIIATYAKSSAVFKELLLMHSQVAVSLDLMHSDQLMKQEIQGKRHCLLVIRCITDAVWEKQY